MSDTPEQTPEATPQPSVALMPIADALVGGPDDAPFVDPGEQVQTLKFHFTPRDALAGEMERLQTENPHAKATWIVPKVLAALNEVFGAGRQ